MFITENERISRSVMFMDIAVIVSMRSACLRAQVGALIELDGRIISTGYNGVPSGFPHCTPENDFSLNSNPCMGKGCNRSIHAEANAIAFAAKEGISIKGATLYCTMSPCINCAKMIINSGITKVVYLKEYRDTEPLNLLDRAGILVDSLHYIQPLRLINNTSLLAQSNSISLKDLSYMMLHAVESIKNADPQKGDETLKKREGVTLGPWGISPNLKTGGIDFIYQEMGLKGKSVDEIAEELIHPPVEENLNQVDKEKILDVIKDNKKMMEVVNKYKDIPTK